MQEIIIIGRGGQGAQTAGNLLAEAFFAEGKFVQSFATYGGARRGTPVTSAIRVDDKPVRLRCNIERPTAMLCFDGSLLDASLLQTVDRETRILVNTHKPKEAFKDLGDYRIVPIDGHEIALKFGMGQVVNSALLGAFVAILEQPDIKTMCDVIEQTAPAKKKENLAACQYAYDLARKAS